MPTDRAETRASLNWAPAAIALIGILAGVGFLNISADPSPTAANYADQRVLREYVRVGLFLIGVVAPLISLALGLIRRTLIGALAGAAAVAFMAIWVPSLLRACCGGDESSVIGLLRAINAAQQAYSATCAGDKGFAPTLKVLTTPPPGPANPPYLTPTAAEGLWRGYAVTMQVADGAAVDFVACDGTRLVSSYFVEAHSIDAIPGRRNFATDQSGVIYAKSDGTSIQPGMAGAEPVQ